MADPRQWAIIEKIAEMARDITTTNGYNNSVLEVNTEDVSFENLREFPAINVLIGTETYLNNTLSEAGRLMKTMNVTLDCYLRGSEERQKFAAKFAADLELRFCDDTPGASSAYNLEGEALIVLPVSSTPFNIANNEELYGFEWVMQVKYRQQRKDPTVQY